MKQWWIFIFIGLFIQVKGQQCAQIQQITVNNQSKDTVCVNSTVQFLIKGSNFPQGGIVDWYVGATPSFDPLSQGIWIDSSVIGSTSSSCPSRCPDIVAIMFNSCGGSNEPGNEYILLNSGDGFKVNDLEVDLPNNFATDNSSGDINLSSIAPNICGFRVPETFIKNSIISGSCNSSNVIAAGPGDIIPPDAWVLIFTSTGVSVTYDMQSLCQTGNKIYILQSNCTRSGGAFTNSASCGNQYTTNLYLNNCPCSDALTIDRCNLSNTDGEYARDIGLPISSVANGGILVNSPPCSSPPYSSLKLIETSVALNWTIPQNFCSNRNLFVKAIINQNGTCSEVISGSTALTIVCTDIEINTLATKYCSGTTLPISIKIPDPLINYSYSISTAGGISASMPISSTDEKQDIVVTVPSGITGRLDLNVTANYSGCQSSKLYSFDFGGSIISGLPDKVLQCSLDPITLTANAGYDSYSWNTGANLPSITVQNSGTYIVTITQGTCSIKDTVQVNLGQGINTNISQKSPTCNESKDGQISVTASGGTSPYSIIWNTQSKDFLLKNIQSGSYNFIITDNAGCTLKDTITLLAPKPISAELNVTLPTCNGTENGKIWLTNVQNAQGMLSISMNGGEYSNTLSYSNLKAGNYMLTLKDGVGCTASLDTTLTEPLPIVILLQDVIDAAPGETITLIPTVQNSQGVIRYTWFPSSGLSCTSCASPKVTTEEEKTYYLSVKDSKNCTASDSVKIHFYIPHIIDIATAFDPMSKNKNNTIYILGNRYVKEILTFKIFNRWGELLHESYNVPINNPMYGWNGYYKGVLQPQDTYIYLVEVEFIDGYISQDRGSFLLLR
jgi:gliding motility-associated-like protein